MPRRRRVRSEPFLTPERLLELLEQIWARRKARIAAGLPPDALDPEEELEEEAEDDEEEDEPKEEDVGDADYGDLQAKYNALPGRPDDPVKAIRAALREALVYYYPIAGRLREDGAGRLVVDCTAEGVVFVEAYVDARLEEFGEPLLPPYPCVEELLCPVGETRAVVGKPLLFMQVTRLKCGGFVLGFHICHNLADGFGMAQFIKAVSDIARGEAAPTILPVWERELLTSRSLLPRPITRLYPAHEPPANGSGSAARDMMLSVPPQSMVAKYFLFGPREVSALRGRIPAGHPARSATIFELVTAVMWRGRTVALGYEPGQRVRLITTMNARGRWNNHTPIPWGYYGNAHVSPIAEAVVGELRAQPLADTVELVRETKRGMTKERMESMVEAVALLREWPPSTMDRIYEVSDVRWMAVNVLDFGWADLAGGGIPLAGDLTSKLGSDHMWCRNENGEVSTVVSMLLPRAAMDRFTEEIAVWLSHKDDEKNLAIMSSL
ncbi:Omega-hydroxypalmitate O-feruloyl transferase [Triticum urartu]|uniref:Omega-hydroxypalmitate O-feruloyl transferase n=1 Tax=Triticum urartu TaxID=4572 RepID=M8AN11_TRIUA|nr:Omega-hydroxypalmitate O-feruloyl transferase [Triticum urartu]